MSVAGLKKQFHKASQVGGAEQGAGVGGHWGAGSPRPHAFGNRTALAPFLGSVSSRLRARGGGVRVAGSLLPSPRPRSSRSHWNSEDLWGQRRWRAAGSPRGRGWASGDLAEDSLARHWEEDSGSAVLAQASAGWGRGVLGPGARPCARPAMDPLDCAQLWEGAPHCHPSSPATPPPGVPQDGYQALSLRGLLLRYGETPRQARKQTVLDTPPRAGRQITLRGRAGEFSGRG